MTIDLETARQAVLREVRAIKAEHPAVQLHLLYTPELHDPLDLVSDTRRETVLIHPPSHLKVIAPDKEQAPRLVTLDCRRVAAYLLENDPALDDPAFESSITQAHAETHLAQTQDAELHNEQREFSAFTVGGWLLSAESAAALGERLQRFSQQQRAWVRWTNPVILSALWPTMTAEQRFAMLGEATWLAFDAVGALRRYSGNDRGPNASAGGGLSTQQGSAENASIPTPRLNDQQQQVLRNAPLVRDLISSWQAIVAGQGRRLPADAEQQLHATVVAAQQTGLDAESVAIHAMTAVQLKHGATSDPEWTKLIQHAANHGLPLRDLLGQLSDEFWDRHSYDEDEA